MYRQSVARLYSSFGQQRKLFLLVFLWTCLCLVIFKSSLLSGATGGRGSDAVVVVNSDSTPEQLLQLSAAHVGAGDKLHARSATPLYLAPEFALPDNSNNDAIYYSLSSISAAPALPLPVINRHLEEAVDNHQASQQSAAIASPLQQQHQQHQQQQQQQQHGKPHSVTTTKHTNEFNVAGSQCNYDYPSLFDLQFNNIHWQKMTTRTVATDSGSQVNGNNSQPQATYYLYNAYYDDRWRGGLPSIRILAMIDRIQPPPTNCLLWSSRIRKLGSPREPAHSLGANLTAQQQSGDPRHLRPLVTRANFIYAWYPKWGNYKDGLLQPWIVTCPMPREHVGLVPDSVSLVEVPPEIIPPVESQFSNDEDLIEEPPRPKRDLEQSNEVLSEQQQQQVQQPASIAMPPSFSSSSPSIPSAAASSGRPASTGSGQQQQQQVHRSAATSSANQQHQSPPPAPVTTTAKQYDCKQSLPITNNLPVYNQRPAVKQKFAVCVKGLDFPHEDVSVRLVEWIELLNLLGAGKIFLYNLDVHENISKVLHYYQKRGIVELSPITLPGVQPNLPEYQHLYLKSKLTAKRQNELIPYNDCLYRNLNSYQYLALLDIDEIIMPLKQHRNWYDLMSQVETMSLSEQNYSRASYNVRNVYFFDDLQGLLGTTSSSSSSSPVEEQQQQFAAVGNVENNNNQVDPTNADEEDELDKSTDSMELGIPHYLHMMQHVYRSKNYTKPGQYVKCFHNTERVVSLHNHFPMNCFGQCTTYSIPVTLAHLQHYRKDCVGPLKQSCKSDFRVFTTRDTTIWKYKQQMIRRTTRVLNHLGLLKPPPAPVPEPPPLPIPS